MSTNLKKKKKENWTGEEVVVLLEEVERVSCISLRLHLYIATRMILKGYGHLHTRAGSCQLRKIVKLLYMYVGLLVV